MKVHFKFPREIDGKFYKPGNHELSQSDMSHWYFKALVKQGDVVVVEEPAVIPVPVEAPVSKGLKKKKE